ncbi:MAG: acriflavin resistance protein [Desulfobulbaceae bacterium A2]|nr:MAG: acriflavin resistance protein [Desulfobulbaceae bacterium A2]
MTAFVRFTLTQRVLLNLLFAVLMVAGAWSLLRMPADRYPNIHFGKVMIDTYYPGAGPEDVEVLVTKKIEDALQDLENVEYVRSNSYREHSNILVKFIDDCDYARGYDELRFRVQTILRELPAEIDPPRFNDLDVNDWFPAVGVNIHGDRSNRALTLVAKELQARLERLEGVKEVRLLGEQTREFHLLLAPQRMQALGITFGQVVTALEQANISLPAGDQMSSNGEFMLRVDERFRSRDQVMATIVRRDGDGSFVRIADLAEDGRIAYRDPLQLASANGEDCVTLWVLKNNQGNALAIARRVRQLVESQRHVYATEDIRLSISQDSTLKIKDGLHVLGSNLLVGIILVSLLIWMMMGARNALLTIVGIPFSFLVTMIVMELTGNSINEVTLFSFVLVSGMLVDDAIVMVENIFRHVQLGKPLEDAVVDGAAEVFIPIANSSLTTIASFMPLLVMSGSIGDFFALIPKAVSFALLASLFECLLMLPLHYMDVGPRNVSMGELAHCCHIRFGNMSLALNDTRFLAWNRRFFNPLLSWTLSRPRTSLVTLCAAFLLAIGIFFVSLAGWSNLIRITFFPDDYSTYFVEVDGPTGTSIEKTHDLLRRISAEIMAGGPGQAESAIGFAGFYINEDYTPVWGRHLGHVGVTLPAADKRRFADAPRNDVLAHLETMRQRLDHFRSEGFSLRLRAEKDGPPAGKDVNIRILGSNGDKVQQLAEHLMHYLHSDPVLAPELRNLNDNRGRPGRVCRYRVQHELAAEHGLSPAAVALQAATVLNGRLAGKFRLLDEEVDLKVMVATSPTGGIEASLAVPVLEDPAGPLRLGDLCRLEYQAEAGFLNRFQRERAMVITADLKPGGNLSAATLQRRVNAHFDSVRAEYPGLRLDFAGEFESTRRSYNSLAYAFFIAQLLIYLLLAAQFKSYVQPLIVMSSVVFALTGMIFGAMFSRSLFTINSFIAVVGVTGVVVNDALVLVEFLNASRREGWGLCESIVRAANIRLRPILLTTLTTVLGLLPLALGIPEYSVVWSTMAMTFVTGLSTATFLTIVIVPVEWLLIERWKEQRRQGGQGQNSLTGPPSIVIAQGRAASDNDQGTAGNSPAVGTGNS